MTASTSSTPPSSAVPYSWNLPLSMDGKILGAAYEVIMDKGLPNTTISEIAQRAGISRPTLYRRFSDLDAIVGGLVISLVLHIMYSRYRLVDTTEELIDLILDAVLDLNEQPLLNELYQTAGEYVFSYLVERLGTSQREIISVLAALFHHVRNVNPDQIRKADDVELATMTLNILQGTSLSAKSTENLITQEQWRYYMQAALRGLLFPDSLMIPEGRTRESNASPTESTVARAYSAEDAQQQL